MSKRLDLEFPILTVKGASANSYTANIFDPVHFYLQGNDYMQADLRKLCDSLVFEIPWQKGTQLSRKIYFHEIGKAELISGWDHRFISRMVEFVALRHTRMANSFTMMEYRFHYQIIKTF